MVGALRASLRAAGLGIWSLLGVRAATQSRFDRDGIERPWLVSWRAVPKRSAGPGFGPADYLEARSRADRVAEQTLGKETWARLLRDGYLDVSSRLFPGLSYRLRIGRRVQLVWDDPAQAGRSPWPFEWLCINPTYPLPASEFAAHLYLYIRDREEDVVRIAAPQPFDQALGRCF